MTTAAFYDQLADAYHLIYADWEAGIQRQATALHSIIHDFFGANCREIVDVACGIGTQALGLAQLGYQITASDLSSSEVERATREAAARQLPIHFSVADMRHAYEHHQRQFDLVLACDNSVPHLLTDADLLTAFRQFYQLTRPGGGCLITVRDYDQEVREGVQVKPYGVKDVDGTRYIMLQVWEFHVQVYDLTMYKIADQGGATCQTEVMRTQYYAVSTRTLMDLMQQAGFMDVQRLDGRFFQPVLIGKKGGDPQC